MSNCTIENCPNEAVAKGLCPQHYMRVRRTGSATAPPAKPGPKPKKPSGNGIDTAALQAEIARLTAENAALRREAETAGKTTAPPRPILHRPPPTPVTEPPLSMTAQERLDAHKRRLEADFERRMQEEVRSRIEERLRAVYSENDRLRADLNAARRGVFTEAQFRVLLASTHTDRVSDPAQKAIYRENFELLQDHKLIIVKPEEEPLQPSAVPRAAEDWMAARDNATAKRAARRATRQRRTEAEAPVDAEADPDAL